MCSLSNENNRDYQVPFQSLGMKHSFNLGSVNTYCYNSIQACAPKSSFLWSDLTRNGSVREIHYPSPSNARWSVPLNRAHCTWIRIKTYYYNIYWLLNFFLGSTNMALILWALFWGGVLEYSLPVNRACFHSCSTKGEKHQSSNLS